MIVFNTWINLKITWPIHNSEKDKKNNYANAGTDMVTLDIVTRFHWWYKPNWQKIDCTANNNSNIIIKYNGTNNN